jgi:hypothetical protein
MGIESTGRLSEKEIEQEGLEEAVVRSEHLKSDLPYKKAPKREILK